MENVTKKYRWGSLYKKRKYLLAIEFLDGKKRSGNRINKYLQFLKTLFRVLAKPAR